MLPVFLYVLKKENYVDISSLIKDVFKIIICSIVFILTIILLNPLNFGLIIIISLIVYLAMIITTKTLNADDISLIKSLFERKTD
jgi:hypothetical protein